MPRKTKTKKGRRRRYGGKRIGAGGLHYPIGRGNMGGGGPYYLYRDKEEPVRGTPVEEPKPKEPEIPKAYDFSSARFSGVPMTYSFPKAAPPQYAGTPAWQNFTMGTADSSLSSEPKLKSQAKINRRREVARQMARTTIPAPSWPEPEPRAPPPEPDMSIPEGRAQSVWRNNDVSMTDAPIDDDVVMTDVSVPETVPIPDAPAAVQTPANFTVNPSIAGPFVFNPPKSRWHRQEQSTATPHVPAMKPPEAPVLQLPTRATEPEIEFDQVYEPPAVEQTFSVVNPMRQFEESHVQTPPTQRPVQSEPRTWQRPPPIEIPKGPEGFDYDRPRRGPPPPIVPTDAPFSGPQTENSRHFLATGDAVPHIPVVEELGKRKEPPTAGRRWDTKKVKLSEPEPTLGKRKEPPTAGRRWDTKKVKMTEEPTGFKFGEGGDLTFNVTPQRFLLEDDGKELPSVQEPTQGTKRKEPPTAGRRWDTKKVKMTVEEPITGKRKDHPTSDRRWDTKKVRISDDLHLGKRKKEDSQFLSRKRIKRTELPDAGPPIIPSDSVLALNPFMRSDQRNRVLYPNLPRNLQTGNVERDMTFLGAVNMNQDVFQDFVGYLPHGHPFFEEYNNLFV